MACKKEVFLFVFMFVTSVVQRKINKTIHLLGYALDDQLTVAAE